MCLTVMLLGFQYIKADNENALYLSLNRLYQMDIATLEKAGQKIKSAQSYNESIQNDPVLSLFDLDSVFNSNVSQYDQRKTCRQIASLLVDQIPTAINELNDLLEKKLEWENSQNKATHQSNATDPSEHAINILKKEYDINDKTISQLFEKKNLNLKERELNLIRLN